MEILAFLWMIISSVIKLIVWATYVIPFIGFRILEWLNLWPCWWPLDAMC